MRGKAKKAKDLHAGSEVVVSSGRMHRSLHFRLATLIAGGLFLLAFVIGGVVLVARHNDSGASKEKLFYPKTEAQAAKSQLVQTKAAAPASTASVVDKAAYYDKLMYVSAGGGDYKGAVAAFKNKEALGSSVVTYQNYYDVAQYYHQLGDNAAALKALDSAEQLLPADGAGGEGYDRASVLETINTLRQGYKS